MEKTTDVSFRPRFDPKPKSFKGPQAWEEFPIDQSCLQRPTMQSRKAVRVQVVLQQQGAGGQGDGQKRAELGKR